MHTLGHFLVILASAAAMSAASAQHVKEKRVGGIKPVLNTNNVPKEVIKLALTKFDTVRDYLEQENQKISDFWLTDAVVGQINYQIVSGVLYYVTVLVGESTCSHNAPIDLSKCSLTPSQDARAVFECKVRVWFQPWVPFLEAVDIQKDCQLSDMLMTS